MLSAGHMTAQEVEVLTEELGVSIRETLSQVESADKAPALSSMFDDVFAEQTWFLREQAEEAERYGIPKVH